MTLALLEVQEAPSLLYNGRSEEQVSEMAIEQQVPELGLKSRVLALPVRHYVLVLTETAM